MGEVLRYCLARKATEQRNRLVSPTACLNKYDLQPGKKMMPDLRRQGVRHRSSNGGGDQLMLGSSGHES
jgi:hypothetical protein